MFFLEINFTIFLYVLLYNIILLTFSLQVPESKVEWAVALYDYAAKSDDELSFQQGDRILVTKHLNEEWSSGRLSGREGMFPRNFIEINTGIKI